MTIHFPVEEAVKKRYSVRNYKKQEVELEIKNKIDTFIQSLDNPFQKEVNFHFLETKDAEDQQKLGTYGVIIGAKQYIGITIKQEEMALEALGYELEVLILYLAYLGIGTCWLGGTFNRKAFASAMNIRDEELFPIMTPYGYPAAKKHVKEAIMRKMVQADHRKDWAEIFFQNDFQTPLSKEAAGDLSFLLEMVRLAPSASNKQPWRILLKDNICHFYEYKEPNYSDRFTYDIQRVDIGIAAAHFDLAANEKVIKGSFALGMQPDLLLPPNIEYIFSWVRD